ncbi:MAG: CoA transferase [Deltaproteobacteria bacterium]|nr:CoA transferase [Deltaproteobacteria bacterium]
MSTEGESESLLAGLRVLDLAGEPGAMTGRILADLGAEVVHVEPPEGDPLRRTPPFAASDRRSLRFGAWSAGKSSVVLASEDPRLDELLRGADVVLETPGFPDSPTLDPKRAPAAVWLRITPFGLAGPRAAWRASDLGVMAASGNMFSTGEPDRAPVRCTEPSGYAHAGPEAAYAVLTALASGRPQVIDLAMQEVVTVANMSGVASAFRGGGPGKRHGANIGRTREIWPCKDGFVSFGLRGGRARVPSLQTLTAMLFEEGLDTPAWTDRDWNAFDQFKVSDEDLAALEEPLGRLFARKTMTELYERACETNLMLAPVNTPREMLASAQSRAREVFRDVGALRSLPARIAIVASHDGRARSIEARADAPELGRDSVPAWTARSVPAVQASREAHGTPAWSAASSAGGPLRIVEFGAGAAGPIAARYFAEHGAIVVKVESKTRPEFLRAMYASTSPHGLEGSQLFDALNAGKRSITLDLKNPRGVEIARRLMHWADAVLENFAPRAMRGFGLDYETIAAEKPDLVMVSTCLNGQTGPHRNYPGFGGQGSALSGFNDLTGWPDREPAGPFGTITDSLAPRFAATALAAGLHYRRRTGCGVHLDIAQVEVAQYALAPWILAYADDGRIYARNGNRSERTAPHGAFSCRGEDRWVAIAVWSDAEWARLAAHLGSEAREAKLARTEDRLARESEVEALVAAWTHERTREEVAEILQAEGIEAVPVQDFEDLLRDPQLAAREHFANLEHPYLGPSPYERNGFRLSDASSGYARPSPLLGEHTDEVLRDFLGCDAAEISELRASGGVE